jgi:hypothetical protein
VSLGRNQDRQANIPDRPPLAPVGPSPLLTREQVRELLGVSDWELRTLLRNGLPAILSDSGEPVRFHRAEVLRYWEHGREAERPDPVAQIVADFLAGGITIRPAEVLRRKEARG